MIQSIAVFCGSRLGQDPEYILQTQKLGEDLAYRGLTLIYGGGGAGLMGVLADAALKKGGKVVGVIPQFLHTPERKHENLTELFEVKTMHERKSLIYEKADAAIVLPGGLGTMDEFFEILTWNQLTLHHKKVGLFNIGGYFDHLFSHLVQMEKEGFIYSPLKSMVTLVSSCEELWEAWIH
ncbi:MAG: LOG family protein [Chitinophagaceae bacterium]